MTPEEQTKLEVELSETIYENLYDLKKLETKRFMSDFGCEVHEFQHENGVINTAVAYATDIYRAWFLVEELRAIGWEHVSYGRTHGFTKKGSKSVYRAEYWAEGETDALAICQAVIAWMVGEEKQGAFK